jgi:hypothetical protein
LAGGKSTKPSSFGDDPKIDDRSSSSRSNASVESERHEFVRPDGLSVRRRRHENGWSPRDLIIAIETASIEASGLRRTLTPNLIKAIEEQSEAIPYDQLLLLADALRCDPVDLIAEGEFSTRRATRRMN